MRSGLSIVKMWWDLQARLNWQGKDTCGALSSSSMSSPFSLKQGRGRKMWDVWASHSYWAVLSLGHPLLQEIEASHHQQKSWRSGLWLQQIVPRPLFLVSFPLGLVPVYLSPQEGAHGGDSVGKLGMDGNTEAYNIQSNQGHMWWVGDDQDDELQVWLEQGNHLLVLCHSLLWYWCTEAYVDDRWVAIWDHCLRLCPTAWAWAPADYGVWG
jgi:hypothetical protein